MSSASMRGMEEQRSPASPRARSPVLVGAAAGLAGACLGLAAGFFVGRGHGGVASLSPQAEEARRAKVRFVQAEPEPPGEASRDELCFDRVEPSAFRIANGDLEAGSKELEAYADFLARQQRDGPD